ncbi:MAG: hypothetical protein H6Q16_1889 [Bacteroidetes bacterium]|nr:hypothetical protein [Bacteroidota bacterium]
MKDQLKTEKILSLQTKQYTLKSLILLIFKNKFFLEVNLIDE